MKFKIDSQMDDTIPTGSDISPPRSPRRRSGARDGSDPIDLHVGARIRTRRAIQGLSQERLGDMIGLTCQQVQKYEHGANRVSASTLYRIAEALGVTVAFFFEELPGSPGFSPVPQDGRRWRRESIALLRNYYSLPEAVRKRVHDLVKVLGRDAGDDGK